MAKASDHKYVSICKCKEAQPSSTLVPNLYPSVPPSALVTRPIIGLSSARPKEQPD